MKNDMEGHFYKVLQQTQTSASQETPNESSISL